MTTVSNNIKTLRNNAFITVQDFSKNLNVTIDIVNKWEDGTVSPNEEELIKICNILNTSVDEINNPNSLNNNSSNENSNSVRKTANRIYKTTLILLPIIVITVSLILKYSGFSEFYVKNVYENLDLTVGLINRYAIKHSLMVAGCFNEILIITWLVKVYKFKFNKWLIVILIACFPFFIMLSTVGMIFTLIYSYYQLFIKH